MTNQRTFKMHPKLLFQTIQRQAGTLAKAITEGVMNSIEAGADYCDVTVTKEAVLIEDNGRGFQSMDEIENWFETFGAPHEESEVKIWANFRIGRGQMFSFGRNTWATRKFVMDVDFKEMAEKSDELKYDLHEANDEEAFDGCQVLIDLYQPLMPSDLDRIVKELKQMVRWVHKPVYINGDEVSKDPAQQKWDYEDVDCYVKLRQNGGLSVYNLGVFVREYPGHYFGAGGDVVSKHQLKLNQARNDVLVNECLIWAEVKKQISKFAGEKISRKASLTADERQRLADQLVSGETDQATALDQKLFTDCNGRHYSWRQLCNLRNRFPAYTEAQRYNRVADKLHQQQLAFVFAVETLERFECETAEEMIDKIQPQFSPNWKFRLPYKQFEDVSDSFKHGYETVTPKSWTVKERIVVNLCEKLGSICVNHLRSRTGVSTEPRKYVVGISDAADGWTDGETYIALSRSWLKNRDFLNLTQLYELGTLLLHEYCHTEADQESHTHSPEFYQTFHDANDAVGDFMQYALGWITELYRREKGKLSKRLTRELDKVERLKRHQGISKDIEGLENQLSQATAARSSLQ